MANDDKDGKVGDEAAAAVEIVGLDWDCRLKSLERIEADPEDDDLEDLFALTFNVDGPNASAEIEIMVADVDDVEAVAVGLATLHGALTAWADLIQRRRDAVRIEMSES